MRTGKSGISGWLVRPAAWMVAAAVVPRPPVELVAVSAAVAGLLCACRRWHGAGRGPLRLVRAGAVLVLRLALASPVPGLTWAYLLPVRRRALRGGVTFCAIVVTGACRWVRERGVRQGPAERPKPVPAASF